MDEFLILQLGLMDFLLFFLVEGVSLVQQLLQGHHRHFLFHGQGFDYVVEVGFYLVVVHAILAD